MELKAGSNLVVYTGKAQSAADAFASIISYLEIAYYYNNITKSYEQVTTTTIMVPYGCYWVDVTQDCTWTYGADATPPTSIQLYSGWNHVPYLGPVQSAEIAFASIMPYLTVAFYYNNITKSYESVIYTTTMVPREVVYAINVTQNCVWSFVAPEPPFTEITEIVAPSSAVAGETVNIEVKVKNLATYAINITVTGRVDGLDLDFGDVYYSVPAGGTQSFYDAFIMPSRGVVITAWSWYKIDGWPEYPDDEAEKVVSLEEVEIFTGTISRKELEYDESRSGIPVY